jgi:hypothetical protein
MLATAEGTPVAVPLLQPYRGRRRPAFVIRTPLSPAGQSVSAGRNAKAPSWT